MLVSSTSDTNSLSTVWRRRRWRTQLRWRKTAPRIRNARGRRAGHVISYPLHRTALRANATSLPWTARKEKKCETRYEAGALSTSLRLMLLFKAFNCIERGEEDDHLFCQISSFLPQSQSESDVFKTPFWHDRGAAHTHFIFRIVAAVAIAQKTPLVMQRWTTFCQTHPE